MCKPIIGDIIEFPVPRAEKREPKSGTVVKLYEFHFLVKLKNYIKSVQHSDKFIIKY